MLLAVAGCGDDGGGDEAAFCDDLEELSDQVADGDLASNDGLEDALDRVNQLIESAADGEQLDAVEEVGQELEDADAENAGDSAELVQDELGDIAEDTCDIDDDDFAVGPEITTTTTTGPDETTTTEAAGEDEADDLEVNGRQAVPDDLEQDGDFPALAEACFNGDPGACDELFNATPGGSVAEAYGATCGGRVVGGTPPHCATLITGPVPVPADVTDPNAAACFDGDMVACDEQFTAAEAGSPDQFYGGLCGGRVLNTSAFCVDIFGDEALV